MLPVLAMNLFATQHGVATGSRLRECGVSRRAVIRAVEAGSFEVFRERVYRIVSSPLTLEARCVALSLARPRGFVTGPGARGSGQEALG